jgi:hypothetical protein
MSEDFTTREPSQAEVQQAEPEAFMPAEVPVKVEGPVRAQILPPTTWAVRSFEVDNLEAQKIVNRDPRRARVLVTAQAVVWIGPAQATAKVSVGFRLPAATVLELLHTEEVWVIADTGTTTVSISESYWTE